MLEADRRATRWTRGGSVIKRALALALVAVAGSLLLVACTAGEAGPGAGGTTGQTPAATATTTPAATGEPSPAGGNLPRRTPAPVPAIHDPSSQLVFAHTTVEVSPGKLTIADTRMVAEEVYFTVKNMGEEEHEIVVVRWDGDPGKLPVDQAVNEVVAASQIVASSEPIKGGNTEIFEIEPIAPGKYVIFCNEPGHYQRGEYKGFEVVAPQR